MSLEKDDIPGTGPASTEIHGHPGDEVIAAKELATGATAVAMKKDPDSEKAEEGKKGEDYDSQSEEKATLGNYFVGAKTNVRGLKGH